MIVKNFNLIFMDKSLKLTIYFCTLLIGMMIQWAVHSQKNEVSFLWDILPIFIVLSFALYYATR